MVWAEDGNQPDVSILVDGLGLVSSGSGDGGLVRDVVGTVVLVDFAVGIHHGCFVSFASKTIFLQMAFLLTVSADNVGVPDHGGGASLVVAVVAGLAVVLEVRKALVVRVNDRNLVQHLVS